MPFLGFICIELQTDIDKDSFSTGTFQVADYVVSPSGKAEKFLCLTSY